jgi:predicted transposase/invertase (TIGR01784 family)
MCKINLRVDFAFKLIFGSEQNKDILLSLLNSILEDYQAYPIESIEILNPFIGKDYSKGKLVILDIRARDERGEYYHIEMQITDQYYYSKRALYYWAKLYESQLKEAIGFNNLTRTVSINILNFKALKKIKYHSAHRIKDLDDNTELTDQLEIHFIELEKFTKDLPDLKKTLDRWIYFLKHAEKFTKDNLPEELKEVEPIKKASELLDKVSLNDEEREIYEARLKLLRDEEGAIETARLRGVEEGEKNKLKEIVKKSLQMNLSIEQINQLTGLKPDEIEKLTDEN